MTKKSFETTMTWAAGGSFAAQMAGARYLIRQTVSTAVS